MNINKTIIPGCYEIFSPRFEDNRGLFVKTFHHNLFLNYGLDVNFQETYYSVSHRGVLRGLHFQNPPEDHVKLVCCLSGKVLDVVVDLRVNSPTYGKYNIFDLSHERGNQIYIPKGLAHGFYVISESATLLYQVSTVYSNINDNGIAWDSVGIPWPDKNPLVSDRDASFKSLDEFKSPFHFSENSGG